MHVHRTQKKPPVPPQPALEPMLEADRRAGRGAEDRSTQPAPRGAGGLQHAPQPGLDGSDRPAAPQQPAPAQHRRTQRWSERASQRSAGSLTRVPPSAARNPREGGARARRRRRSGRGRLGHHEPGEQHAARRSPRGQPPRQRPRCPPPPPSRAARRPSPENSAHLYGVHPEGPGERSRAVSGVSGGLARLAAPLRCPSTGMALDRGRAESLAHSVFF